MPSDPIMQGSPAQDIRNYLTAQRLPEYLASGHTLSAKEEALQQPTFDPIMLIAAILSGGASAGPEALANQKMRMSILSDLAQLGKDSPAMAKTLQNALEQTPGLAKTLANSVGRAARNFTGANALGNLMNPNHPSFNNWLALLNVPEVDIKGLPPWVRAQAARTDPLRTPSPTEAEPLMLNPQVLSPAMTLSLGTLRALQSMEMRAK